MKKTIQDLTIRSNFMFAAVMLDPKNCKDLLERALGIPIDHVEVDREKSLIYHPEYKSVRLDVYAKDGKGSHFNVEMQVVTEHLTKRARYYHSQLDMNLLLSGVSYDELPDCYVIFICDFDPFGLKKYRYTLRETFCEDETYSYRDGAHTLFLSTKGTNDTEVPSELLKLLKFIGADKDRMEDDFSDEYVTRLQETIRRIKRDREMGARYMLFEELLNDERKAGRAEGRAEGRAIGQAEFILDILSEHFAVPEELRTRILSEKDLATLKEWLKIAINAESPEQFCKESNLI